VIEILGIDHVQLSMPAGGEDEARRFYGSLLGLLEDPEPRGKVASEPRGAGWIRSPTAGRPPSPRLSCLMPGWWAFG